MIRPKNDRATQERLWGLLLGKATLRDKRWAANLLVQWELFGEWFTGVKPEELAAKLPYPRLSLLAMDMYNMSQKAHISKCFVAAKAVEDFEAMLASSQAKLADIGLTEKDVAKMKKRCYILEVKLFLRIVLRGDDLAVEAFEQTERLMRKWDVCEIDLGDEFILKDVWQIACIARVKSLIRTVSSQRFLRDDRLLLDIWLCSRETGLTFEELGFTEMDFKEFQNKTLR